MKQGLNKLTGTQGARASKGQKIGEEYIRRILDILEIEIFINIDSNKKTKNISYVLKPEQENNFFETKNNQKDSISMTPDFIIKNPKNSKFDSTKIEWIFLESKYKQIQGSDWEKLESNFGYHEYFYNSLLECNSKTIVIFTGFWKKLQKPYMVWTEYFKTRYGMHCIFDFGLSYDEIFRFSEILGMNINEEQKKEIKKIWNEHINI